MRDVKYVGEYRGYRLVEVPSPRTGLPYRLPEQYAHGSIRACIRALAADGWSQKEIIEVTQISYQQVYNSLIGQRGKERTIDELQLTYGTIIEQNRVDSSLVFSKMIARVERGEEITVTRDGAPVARIVSFTFVRDDA